MLTFKGESLLSIIHDRGEYFNCEREFSSSFHLTNSVKVELHDERPGHDAKGSAGAKAPTGQSTDQWGFEAKVTASILTKDASITNC